MRDLSNFEMACVSGAERHDVIDVVGALQTFLLLMAVTDKQSFAYGSVITGMTAGTIAGAAAGYSYTVASLGAVGGCAAGLGLGAVGMVAGGLAFKGGAYFATNVYDMLMA